MRKYVSILLAITTVATLTGCGSNNKSQDDAQTQKQAEIEAQAEVPDEVTIQSAPEFTYTAIKYEGDSSYFGGSAQCISITDENHKELAVAIDDFFAEKMKDYNKCCEDYAKEAAKANAKVSEDKEKNEGAENEFVYDYAPHYEYDIFVTVTRCDSKVFSFKLEEYTFEGGAHGQTVESGFSFDANTGEEISFISDYSESFKQEVFDNIKASPDFAKEKLFDDYKDTLEDYFKDGMKDVSCWLDYRGATISVGAGDIAPYSEGNLYFTLPYSKMKGVDAKLFPESDFYDANISSMGLADRIDVNGDGKEEVVYLEEDEGDDEQIGSVFDLHVGDKTISLGGGDDELVFCNPYFVHSTAGNYIFIEQSYPIEANRVELYDVAKDFKKIDKAEGKIIDIEDGQITLQKNVDAFGSWPSEKVYSYGKDGFSTDETVDRLMNNPNDVDSKGIKTKAKISYYKKKDGEKIEDTLARGTVIYPVATDGKELEFITEDGETGYFTYETKEFVRYIDGVSENDLFESLPYAG